MLRNQAHVRSSDGTRLAVGEAGRADGPPIVFIHGYCLSKEVWLRQWQDSVLPAQYRLVFFDLRGHGDSDAPPNSETYVDGKLWADDLKAVFEHFEVQKPLIVAWSYGGRMINDYLRHYGALSLSGINYVAAGTIHVEEAVGHAHANMSEMFSPINAHVERAEDVYIANTLDGDPDPELAAIVEDAVRKTPTFVRSAMRRRPLDYERELAALDLPVLISHGSRDSIVSPLMSERLQELIPNASLSIYDGHEHTMFLSDAKRFNKELDRFAAKSFGS